ncbi:MAG TPA: efflux RND transporter periplasmic adaptor subunit, partial [Verrucomicrobiae bacterium]|nr:efflux RND transporter periplasmic adaptor subunit [Verrucomicrobiae bacterium]
YNSAKVSYDLAKAQLETKKAGASSSDLQLAQLQVDQAKSSLASAQAAVTDTTLVAPVDGLITTVNGKVGEMPSGTGAFMVLMGASDSMQITVPVDEADLGSVKVDQSVALTLSAYPDKKFSGKVTQVAPTGKTQNNVTMFDVTVVAPNTDSLMKPGMSANVSIIVAQKNNVLTVPSEAVKGSGEQRSVQLAPESPATQPQSKRVQIGLDDGTNAEVLQGLQEGDQVVTGTKTQKTTTNTQSGGGNRGGVGGMFGR